MKARYFVLSGSVALALVVAACTPAVDSAATETAMEAMEAMHAAETQAVMDAMHAEETQTAMDAMHLAETETAMDAVHAEETQAAASGAEPIMMLSGAFYNLQHVGRGQAVLAGSMEEGYVLKLQGFEVEAGPDLHIVLTSAETVAPDVSNLPDAIDLGLLPAISGDLEIPVPAGVDVSTARTVVIWCQSFSVGFIAAPLAP